MLAVFLVPILFRPIDFSNNARFYLVGLFTYMILMPMFVTIFTVYSMLNLHDVSWGNRPTEHGTGMEAVSDR